MILNSYKYYELAFFPCVTLKGEISPLRKHSPPYLLVKVLGVGHDHPNEGQKEDKKPEPTHVPYLGEWVGL